MTARFGRDAAHLQAPRVITQYIRTNQAAQIELREKELILKAELARSIRRQEVVEGAYARGESYAAIGRRIGRSRQYVYQLLHPEVRRRRERSKRARYSAARARYSANAPGAG